jgi:hypothetical protein
MAGTSVETMDPQITGTDVYRVTGNNGEVRDVKVKLRGTDTDIGKAIELVKALKAAGIPSTREGNKVTIPQARTIELTTNAALQGVKKTSSSKVIKISADFHEGLSGIDVTSAPATYRVAMGYDGLTIDADLVFGDLPDSSLDSLVTAVFGELLADLPADQQSELGIDLFNHVITWSTPQDQMNYFLENDSSDTLLSETGAIELSEAPEYGLFPVPGPLPLFGVFTAFGVSRKIRKRINSN